MIWINTTDVRRLVYRALLLVDHLSILATNGDLITNGGYLNFCVNVLPASEESIFCGDNLSFLIEGGSLGVYVVRLSQRSE
jgi:hypothetical protein